jgi:16S rRNA A1518/A1519 N6-dimethyltransferase RsmA/KsgA/DIM1 with predicted DNA glycosylase/AP lyase activity
VSHPHSGRHELGQNFLHDRGVIDVIVQAVDRNDGPIIEVGAGEGALTCALQELGRPLTAIEIDPRRAARLVARTTHGTRVVPADFLKYPLPRAPQSSSATCRFISRRRYCGASSMAPDGPMLCCWCSGKSPVAERPSAARR